MGGGGASANTSANASASASASASGNGNGSGCGRDSGENGTGGTENERTLPFERCCCACSLDKFGSDLHQHSGFTASVCNLRPKSRSVWSFGGTADSCVPRPQTEMSTVFSTVLFPSVLCCAVLCCAVLCCVGLALWSTEGQWPTEEQSLALEQTFRKLFFFLAFCGHPNEKQQQQQLVDICL